MKGLNIFSEPAIIEKVKDLYNLLKQEKNEYEKAASKIINKQLYHTLITLANGHNKFAEELCAQVKKITGDDDIKQCKEHKIFLAPEVFKNDFEIYAFCRMNEKQLVNAYQEILNHSFLYSGLNKILRSQLNEILCSFTELKLLSKFKANKNNKNDYSGLSVLL
jgi:hypothetical protein